MPPSHSHWLDRSALTLSGLCLVHCLAGSIVVMLLSVGGGWFSHQVHAVGLALALPLAAYALSRGVLQHRRWPVAVLGAAGLSLMGASLLIEHGGTAEVLLSVTGVLTLGAAHLLNLRWSRRASR